MTGLATTPTDQATALANWATQLQPSEEDLALARRSLLDTLAVAYAARDHPLRALFDQLADAGRWAALAHVLDFDDLHMPSTTHISAICVPVALATGGDARAYLAGAGVMARLGTTLGWRHYSAGWHATCTAGAPAAAVTASIALRLDAERTATAIALAIPAAGGVQRAFGSSAKALQVGFAADAGVRAARLAQAG
ncbi:MAG: MmgE/PrpD family protein, partial [Solirubrobacterales bacterium]|nr:MmgE/PrpD family protein [Solirubrobacterales bacterium]